MGVSKGKSMLELEGVKLWGMCVGGQGAREKQKDDGADERGMENPV